MSRRPVGAPIVDWATVRKWRSALKEAGTTTTDLAQQFAPQIARETARFAQGDDILLLVSPSLGGHAALAAARLLRERGFKPRIATEHEFLTSESVPVADLESFPRALSAWDGAVTAFADTRPASVTIDALFPAEGIYYQQPEPAWVERWRWLLERAETTIAIDNVAFGAAVGHKMTQIDRHPVYTLTIALGTLRDQHVTWAAMDYTGHLLLAPADPPIESRSRVLGRPVIEAPDSQAHKYSRGMVVVVAGKMRGAARLTARAAAATGAGYVMLAGRGVHHGAGLDAVVCKRLDAPHDLDILLADQRIDAVVIGPGLGTDDDSRDWLEAALESDRRLVLDADALTLIGKDAQLDRRTPATWITPHSGEWEKLTGDPFYEWGKFGETRMWAEAGIGILHKGADTVIATPEGTGVLDRTPPSWLSTAGTGDVLAGVLAARLAVRQGAWRCGHEAAWLHTRAAQLAGPAFSADRLIDFLPQAIAECR
ncbi:MAG: ADP/ATP-dependent (S)-NAD(P)H-hydrate dehydratase [Pseudomonadota bacterium]